jgi:hypothetical protein
MKHLLKYSEFLNESRSTSISTNGKSILDIIKEYAPWYDVKNVKTRIYRGVNGADVVILNPKLHIRANKWNHLYPYIFDNSEKWHQYPKRSNSLICTNSLLYAQQFGIVHRVIPLSESTLCGVCPSADIFTSFKRLHEFLKSIDTLKNLDDKLELIYMYFGNITPINSELTTIKGQTLYFWFNQLKLLIIYNYSFLRIDNILLIAKFLILVPIG